MGSLLDYCPRAINKLVIIFVYCLSILIYPLLGSTTLHFKWDVEYVHWSPDCFDGLVLAINGQFPGPTIRARAGDTVVVELHNKLHTEGVVIHWHGIRQVILLLVLPFFSIKVLHYLQDSKENGRWVRSG